MTAPDVTAVTGYRPFIAWLSGIAERAEPWGEATHEAEMPRPKAAQYRLWVTSPVRNHAIVPTLITIMDFRGPRLADLRVWHRVVLATGWPFARKYWPGII